MSIIKLQDDVVKFFLTLGNEGIPFHPDTPFNKYYTETGTPRYSEKEVLLREDILNDCRDFCKINSLDIYAIYRSVYSIDAEGRMQKYLPNLFKLLEGQRIDWASINKKLEKEFNKRIRQQDAGKTLFEANLYDIIIASSKGNKSAERLMHYFETLLGELNENLGTAKGKIVNSIYGMLIELDLNYYNYVAELAVLNVLIKSKAYSLVEAESSLGNGNSADFLLKNVNTFKTELIEVVSIRPKIFPPTDEKIIELINQKIKGKISKKTKGNQQYLHFNLIPVFWGSFEELKKISDLVLGKKIKFTPHVMELCAYCTFSNDEADFIEHRFGLLSTMFN